MARDDQPAVNRAGAAMRWRLSPLQCAMAIVVLVAALGWYFWRYEGYTASIIYTAGVTAALAALFAFASRRPFFSVAAVALICLAIDRASATKHATMDQIVHAYDLFFYLGSWSTVSFLAFDYPLLMAKAILGLLAFLVLGWLSYRFDALRIRRKTAAIAFSFAAAVGALGWVSMAERRHMQFFFSNMYISSFYSSWGETVATLWAGTLMEAAPSGAAAMSAAAVQPLRIPDTCTPAQKPPHIVLIHQESVVQPSLFPGLSYNREVDQMFKSHDGVTRKLRVETYGGASWLTEFSILAGVSTQAFGGMRQFVQTFTVNKLKDTLPQSLAQCGYRNVVFYPLNRNFVSNDRFYSSIGLTEIYDMKHQGAPSTQERDRFYYKNALNEMERHFQTGGVGKAGHKPLFTYIQTMSAHWPYDWIMEKDTVVPGGGPGTHPDMHEYLRRVSMAHEDYNYLIREIKTRFPNEPILIVQYGDHQPSATRMLVGYSEDVDFEGLQVKSDHPAFITYYATEWHNYNVPQLPPHEVVDIPYLGLIIHQAAGLPLSDANKERARLMKLCDGRYNSCKQRDQILSFHRRLIDAGIIAAR